MSTQPSHSLKHGKSGSRIYRIWTDIMQRCYNPKRPAYNRYGGRGILVCKRWHNFLNFLEDMGDPQDDFTIDRKDNNKGYSPENCKWATISEQNRNTNRNHHITFNGITMVLSDWAKRLGINSTTLYCRIIKRKWSIEKAFLTPVK